jgi:hypothetical protein
MRGRIGIVLMGRAFWGARGVRDEDWEFGGWVMKTGLILGLGLGNM